MKKDIDTLITVLGWEDRFRLGTDVILNKFNIKKIILITFSDYLNMPNMNTHNSFLTNKANELNIEIEPIELEYSNSILNWKILDNYFNTSKLTNNLLLNITTIPRETIWMLLFFIKQQVNSICYIYFKPQEYGQEWLTKNHKNPRLLFKHSGLFELDKKLALFIITGFDEKRLNSLIEFYEPNKIVYFTQSGNQFSNNIRNTSANLESRIQCEKIEIDNYDIESAIEVLRVEIENNQNYNIILDSQGPKPSSLSTYKNYILSNKRVALAYVPVRDFSTAYSKGFKDCFIVGDLELS